jgi:hypothetical protein
MSGIQTTLTLATRTSLDNQFLAVLTGIASKYFGTITFVFGEAARDLLYEGLQGIEIALL